MKKLLCILFLIFFTHSVYAQNDIVGFWTTVDDETKQPKSVVQIYEYQNHYYGRVVEIFNNKEARAKIKNNPKIIGLDIIWDLKKDDKGFTGGQILDPQKGKVYGCEVWREGDTLIVRGKIAFLGRNQTWLKNDNFSGDIGKIIPTKPTIK